MILPTPQSPSGVRTRPECKKKLRTSHPPGDRRMTSTSVFNSGDGSTKSAVFVQPSVAQLIGYQHRREMLGVRKCEGARLVKWLAWIFVCNVPRSLGHRPITSRALRIAVSRLAVFAPRHLLLIISARVTSRPQDQRLMFDLSFNIQKLAGRIGFVIRK